MSRQVFKLFSYNLSNILHEIICRRHLHLIELTQYVMRSLFDGIDNINRNNFSYK